MPAPAGTGLSRRSFLLRAGGVALSVYGASLLKPQAFAEGIAEGRRRATGACSSRSSSTAARLALAARPGPRPDATSSSAPTSRSSPATGPAWTEDPRLQWHPSAAPLHQLHGEGKVTVFPAIGYAGADQSHFTSRHYWEVGETNVRTNTGWLGRMLDVVGTPDNPMQGLSLDGYLSPSLATAKNPVAATWETDYDLWAPGVWGDVEKLMFERLRPDRRRRGRAAATPGWRPPAT